jgi:RNA methyltransferase, TrmH family
MITKNQIKYIQSLHQKKVRQQEGLFLVEGTKNVLELLHSDFSVKVCYATESFCIDNEKLLQKLQISPEIVPADVLERMSTLANNHTALALVQAKENLVLHAQNEWVLLLDNLQDPGNLGTIIRIADWYGIKKIVASAQTVELYNPKVIMASMGSFTRVAVYYCDLSEYTNTIPNKKIYAAALNGASVYEEKFGGEGYLIIGSESHGVNDKLLARVGCSIRIPRRGGAESLNAAVATAVLLDNIFRG